MRPSSSSGFTSRPSTSHSIRSTSRFSQRPSSALSHRPGSSLSQRPTSRLSQRAPSRHAQRFGPQLRKLVENVTGLSPEDDDEDYEDACDLALRTLETNRYTGLRVNLEEVEARIDGLIEKAQIKGQDVMATALLETRNRLRSTVKEVSETTDDPLIRDSLLPDHIHFLLLLANASTSVTQATAADILHSMRNPPSPPHVLTWEEILAEEPFEGEHWRMPPSPSSSSLSSWSDLPSKPQLMDPQDSSSSSAIEEAPSEKSQELAAVNEGANDAANEDSQITIDDLKQQLYWTDLPPLHDAPFDIGVPSTLGPALASLQRSTSSPPVHISEVNAVREALMALQGCYGYVFQLDSESRQVQIAPSAPVLSHMSPGTFRSLLSAFAETSTTLAHLRHFVDATGRNALAQGPNYRCRTLSAFSEGIEVLLNDFGTWCGEIEMQVCAAEAGSGPEIVVSLLSLRNKLEQETNATFDILWLIARKFCSTSGGSSSRDLRLFDPCSTTQSILDHLLAYSHSHASMGDDKTAASLVKVFTYALTPLWSSLHLWLKDGVPATSALDAAFGSTGGIIHDSEFFIEITDGLLTSPDSWNDACAIRSTMDSGNEGVPECFRAIGSQLLSAGKAVGLLRALGTEDFFYNSGGPGTEHEWLADWVKARVLFDDQLLDGDSAQLDADEIEHHSSTTIDSEQHSALRHSEIRIEDVSARIAQYLLPRCWLAQARLNEVVFDDSRLWDHLRVVEDVYLMRRGDVMADFCDIVYSRMDAGLPWSDFHFLNGAFRDSLEASGCSWINPALMRISYQAATNVSVNPTIAAFGGLTLDYQAPFPLNYMLSPSTKRLYCQVFVLLLQLRRCKAILQKMNFDYAKLPDLDLTGETLRAFYGLKAKLVWFINTFYDHIVTYVIMDETRLFHEALSSAKSFDDMVSQHSTYLNSVLRQCFLSQDSETAHQTVIAILDISLTLRRHFDSISADTSVDLSTLAMREERQAERGRRRKQRLRQSQKRLRKNVIGFASDSMGEDLLDSSSDSSEDFDLSYLSNAAEDQLPGTGPHTQHTWLSRVDDCNIRLENLMKMLTRSVETLSATSEDSLQSFSILAFSLEDWDR